MRSLATAIVFLLTLGASARPLPPDRPEPEPVPKSIVERMPVGETPFGVLRQTNGDFTLGDGPGNVWNAVGTLKQRSDGSIYWFVVWASPLPGPAGRLRAGGGRV